MQLSFTEEEREYIVAEPFNWHIKDDAPEPVRKSLEEKLEAIEDFRRKREEGLLRKREAMLRERAQLSETEGASHGNVL